MVRPTSSFIVRVCSACTAARLRYAVVGGYAVALHGAVRGTLDVDIAVPWTLASLRKAEEAMTELGLVVPRNLLRAFRTKAELIGTPYQTQIKALMRSWVASGD